MDESLKLKNQPMRAGFPNAAADAVFTKLDIASMLIKSPASTYYMRLDGSLTQKSYVPTQTLLVVDRAAKIRSGDIIICSIRGELVLKHYKKVHNRNWLLPVGEDGKALEFAYDEEISIWGVVLHVIESIRGA
jgi:DNA polymerase V